ncbi:endonuclease III domain-containing protein [Buchnera aphidicola]|uniref:Endonuclease III n=1 Tax=Buchnera aphidicola (Cinara cf. splendens/pseudotsugae 3390) TaxID=2518980 RepID=A0A451CWE4_9GAMM|nr:endonuclease III [Buchnera aphidicola]VFP77651.1 Endonuclease III [Buchnera aphidicola (Cinara cf. splendens/pseudotsugae 3390)]
MNKNKRLIILKKFEQHYSSSKIKLKYKTCFELLISIILSAKSSDTQVNKVTKKLFSYMRKPSDVLDLGYDKLKVIIRSVGLFNKKALAIIKTCRILKKIYNENIPMNKDKLLLLPGVGRKTANLFLNIVLKKNFIAVDTHVFRVSNRTNFANGLSPYHVENKLYKCVPIKFQSRLHSWFGLHGRYFCRSLSPKCSMCIIKIWCEYPYKIIK